MACLPKTLPMSHCCTFPVHMHPFHGTNCLSPCSPPLYIHPTAQGTIDKPIIYSANMFANLTTTRAWFNGDPKPVPIVGRDLKNKVLAWSVPLKLTIPANLRSPTLLSLTYSVKYASMSDIGNSTNQLDVVLVPEDLPVESGAVITDINEYNIYAPVENRNGYSPALIDNAKAIWLTSSTGIKVNGVGEAQWSHFINSEHITPNVTFPDAQGSIYLIFHSAEYHNGDWENPRMLCIEVQGTWTQNMENIINQKAEEFGKTCSNGNAWIRTEDGLACTGGSHRITFEQMGLRF